MQFNDNETPIGSGLISMITLSNHLINHALELLVSSSLHLHAHAVIIQNELHRTHLFSRLISVDYKLFMLFILDCGKLRMYSY
jgi:hypothetical protein